MTGVDMVEIRPAPEPVLDPEGALLRVEACGICGTDARTFFNGDPRAPAPWILGHEPVGILEEVGPQAALPPGMKKGDRVFLGSAPIGGWQAAMARDRGAGKVFLTDVNRQRLDVALRAVGSFVDDSWVAGDDNGVAAAMERTEGRGPERVIVAAPSKVAQQAALEMAAKRARVVYFAGLPKHDPVASLDMNQLH